MSPEEAVKAVVERVRLGESPYSGGPLSPMDMVLLTEQLAQHVVHDAFHEEIEKMFTRGEDPGKFISAYLGVVFAQGFNAGSQYERDIDGIH